jgi:hypothetical protein
MKLSSPTVATVLLFALAAPAAAETFTLTTTAGRYADSGGLRGRSGVSVRISAATPLAATRPDGSSAWDATAGNELAEYGPGWALDASTGTWSPTVAWPSKDEVDAWAEANTRGLWQVGFGKRNRRFDTAAWYTPPSFRTYPTVDDASFDAFIDARAIGIVGNIEVRLGASVAGYGADWARLEIRSFTEDFSISSEITAGLALSVTNAKPLPDDAVMMLTLGFRDETVLGKDTLVTVVESVTTYGAAYRTPLAQLQAGQYNVGLDGVIQFTMPKPRSLFLKAGGGAAGAAAVDKWLAKSPAPCVLGPGGRLHLVDRHHRTTAISLLSRDPDPQFAGFPDYTYTTIIADLSDLSGQAFWDRMLLGDTDVGDRRQYVWLFDRGVPQDPLVNPPPLIAGLTDDLMRSLAANVRTICGFDDLEDEDTPGPDYVFYFIEFHWANYLRDRVFLIGSEDRGGNPAAPIQSADQVELVRLAADLCHLPAAMSLPGWISACPGDLDCDRAVGSGDLTMLLSQWGAEVPEYGDLNGDFAVDGADLAIQIGNWGDCGG